MGSINGVCPRGEVLGNLREPRGLRGKIREYRGLLGYVPGLARLPIWGPKSHTHGFWALIAYWHSKWTLWFGPVHEALGTLRADGLAEAVGRLRLVCQSHCPRGPSAKLHSETIVSIPKTEAPKIPYNQLLWTPRVASYR